MNELFHGLRRFFGNRKNRFLPVVFCTISLAMLVVACGPVFGGIQTASSTSGFVPDSSPSGLTEAESAADETVNLSDFGGYPQKGDKYGSVSVAGTAVSCDLYYGDGDAELHSGGGTYAGAQIPGEGGVTLVGAHTVTYFRDLESAQIGADVVVQTTYGTYHYKITDMQIVEAELFGQEQLDEAPRESLLLYTCYPFGQAEITEYRYMVYCEYVSGPRLISTVED